MAQGTFTSGFGQLLRQQEPCTSYFPAFLPPSSAHSPLLGRLGVSLKCIPRGRTLPETHTSLPPLQRGHAQRPPHIAGLTALHHYGTHHVGSTWHIAFRKLQGVQGEEDTVIQHTVSATEAGNGDLPTVMTAWRHRQEMCTRAVHLQEGPRGNAPVSLRRHTDQGIHGRGDSCSDTCQK